MKFICEKSVLQDAVNTAARASAAKSPITSLEGLLIEAESSVKITGYDLKKAIYTKFDADITEQGKCVVNTKLLSEMIRRLPDGNVMFTVDETNNAVTIKCGKSEYNFIGLDIREYPEIPKFDELKSVSMAQGFLKEMIARTLFAVSKDEIRPIYTGSLFEIENNQITIVSVDGYRLAVRSAELENAKLENCSFVVPGFALTDIEKICKDDNEPVDISVGEKHISFSIGNTVLITRRLEGDFINYKKSIPESFRYEIKFDRSEFIEAIDRVSLMVTEGNGSPVRLTFNDNVIECMSITPIGKAEDICTCNGFGEGLLIGFNNRYLLDALKAAENDELKICLNTASSPCVIKAADGSDLFTYMILPVRLHQ